MIRMTTLVGLAAAMFLAAPAWAQLADLEKMQSTTPEQRADFLTKTMTSQLTLTEEQVPKVQDLNLKYAKLQQPVLEDKGELFDRVRKMRQINSTKESSLRKLLSKEQWAEYEKGRSELKEKLEAWAATQGADAQP